MTGFSVGASVLFVALLQVQPALARSVELAAVCFTPGDDCTGLVVQALDGATASVKVQAYTFTSAPIAAALVAAHRRGVAVRVILDHSQAGQRYSAAGFLSRAGIEVLIDTAPGIAHNKIIVIDDARVITGSFNFSASAQRRNVENLVEIDDVETASRFAQNWASRLPHTYPFVGR